MRRIALAALLPAVILGCTRVTVKKNPPAHDAGIRYYRPKPYLFISPGPTDGPSAKAAFNVQSTISQPTPLEVKPVSFEEDGTDAATQPAPPAVESNESGRPANVPKIQIQLVYMPDFAEEYSIQLRPGLGVGELNIKLDNGWNLTSVGMKTDQQTDEIIKSVADLVGAATSPGKTRDQKAKSVETIVHGTNVPFGFYEAIISTDPSGRKQLYGWRYIGFVPFQSCPTRMMGRQNICCDDPDAIYGLVWSEKNGVLMFERLGTIQCDEKFESQYESSSIPASASYEMHDGPYESDVVASE